jgi:protoheme IX farnesyltransferase
MKVLLELTKFRITILTTISGILGYLLQSGYVSFEIIMVVMGILLLASGASALNQVQESKYDKLMKRTGNRPIPAGKLSRKQALVISLTLMLFGEILLLQLPGITPALLGIFSVFWYNGIYTPLKRYTPFAVIPGALIGSIPPAIGWTAAGGSLLEPEIILIMVYFFIWQIPHFWLLLLIFNTQYEDAGYPSLLKIFRKEQLARITFVWAFATVVIALLIPFYGIVDNVYLFLVISALSVWLVFKFYPLIRQNDFSLEFIRKAFMAINIYALSFMIIVFIQIGI